MTVVNKVYYVPEHFLGSRVVHFASMTYKVERLHGVTQTICLTSSAPCHNKKQVRIFEHSIQFIC